MVAIAFVATAWGPRFGGINAFNSDLCVAIARSRPDITVVCVTPSATSAEIDAARTVGVELVSFGASTDGPVDEMFGRALAEWSRTVSDLQWWIGHDVISGPAAVVAAERTQTRVAVIQHTDYASYGSLKGASGVSVLDRDSRESDTLAAADMVFGVGPKLAHAAWDRVRTGRGSAQVETLVPGVPDIQPLEGSPHTFRAISFGRLDERSDRIKQGRLAARAFGRIIAEVPEYVGSDPRITLIGISDEEPQRDQAELNRIVAEAAGGRAVTVIGHPFTEDREKLFRALLTSSVSLMLSTHEGFGLTGWEAIAAEVPLVLSKNSGLYDLLRGMGDSVLGLVHGVTIQASPDPPYYSDQDVETVTAALREIAVNVARARRNAHQLKLMLQGYTWAQTAKTLLAALHLGEISDVSRSGPTKTALAASSMLPISDGPPPSMGPLIGRDEEVARLAELVLSDGPQLVTVMGAPGVGKTSLVAQLARDLAAAFSSRVFFVDLSNVADPSILPASLSRALRVEPRDPIMESLKDYFRQAPTLLVLDNFDTVVDAALLIRELVASVPRLRVLVTSREALRVAGETEFLVESLSPDDAVRLFATVSRRQDTPQSDDDVVRSLCSRLDNLPLAIELVAAQAKLLVGGELARLAETFLDIPANRRDAVSRQHTLGTAIEWSYSRLTPTQQEVFAALSVFVDGFSATSASEVISGNRFDHLLLGEITTLREKSLIQREPQGRLTMLETLRAYASTQLDDSAGAALRTSHALYFLSTVRGLVADPLSRRSCAGSDGLRTESENLGTALDWLISAGRDDEAVELASRLGQSWWSSDPLGGFERLSRCRDLTVTVDGQLSMGIVALWRARLSLRLGRLDQARDDLRSASRIASQHHDSRLQATIDSDEALTLFETGDYRAARPLLESARRFFEASDDAVGLAEVLDSLGIASYEVGAYDEALQFFQDSIDQYVRGDDERGPGWVEADTSKLQSCRSAFDAALESADRALATGVAQQDEHLKTWALYYRGLALCGLGRLDESEPNLAGSVAQARLLGDQRLTLLCLEAYAALRAREGSELRALTIVTAASTLRIAVAIPRSPAEQRVLDFFMAATGVGASERSIELAVRMGRRFTLDQALDYGEIG